MWAVRERALSRHYRLADLLVDANFPELAASLEPEPLVIANLERLAKLLDRLNDRFPPSLEILSGYRDARLNEACRSIGKPASVGSLHLVGCAADLKPRSQEVDSEQVFDWLRLEVDALDLHEVVFYPMKGLLHVAVVDPIRPGSRRILMRV